MSQIAFWSQSNLSGNILKAEKKAEMTEQFGPSKARTFLMKCQKFPLIKRRQMTWFELLQVYSKMTVAIRENFYVLYKFGELCTIKLLLFCNRNIFQLFVWGNQHVT